MLFDAFVRRSCLTMLVLVVTSELAAQGRIDTVTVTPIVVTATRLPTPADAVAPTVTVLRGDGLRAQGLATVADALRGVPGAAVVAAGPFGAQTSLFLRGGESDYVKVLVDGVPVNQPGGAFDWANLTLDNVDRIEVLRGPASVLYGSDAVTGVVQIFTRAAAGPARATATLEAGTYGARRGAIGVSGGGPGASYSLSLSRLSAVGLYPFNNRYRNDVFSGLVRLTPDLRTDAALSVRYTDDLYHFPTDGGGKLVDHRQFNYANGPTLGLDVGHFLAPRVEARLQLAASQTDGGYEDPPDSPADTLGFYTTYRSQDNLRRVGADLRANVYLSPVSIVTLGAATEQEREHSINFCSGRFGDCSSPPVDTGRGTRAAYAQAVTDLGGRLSLNGGLRVEDNQRFGVFLTYRAGAVYRLSGSTRVRASVGTAFKEPTFFQNYATGFVTGNPKLKPEQSRSGEVGIEHGLWNGRIVASAVAFAQRFRNMIDFTFSPPDSGAPNYFNVAAASADGLELALTLRPQAHLTVTGGYVYLTTRVTKPGLDPSSGAAFVARAPLLRRPRHSATLDADLTLGSRGRLTVGVRYVGARIDQDFTSFPFPRLTLPAYTRVDIGGEVELTRTGPGSPGVAARWRVENLFDRSYEEVKNFPARRRAILAGAELRL
jgi:vitamin B12 transporter